MIVNNGKYYLYRHIRLDNNQVFYIGIGTKSKNGLYSRAFMKNQRNIYWFRVTGKTEYTVEILLESNDYNFIEQKEIEFIKLYGRKNLGLGTLVNLTDGGKGSLKILRSKETREKLKLINKGRVVSKESVNKAIATKIINGTLTYTNEQKLNKSLIQQEKIIQYDFCGNILKIWDGINELSCFYKVPKYYVTQCAMKGAKRCIFENDTLLSYQKYTINEKLNININNLCNSNFKPKRKLKIQEINKIIEEYILNYNNELSANQNCKTLSEKLKISKNTIIAILVKNKKYHI